MNISATIFRILICCMIAITAQAQTYEEENAKVMGRMDTESFKGKVLLNKAIVPDYQLEPFRTREKDKEGTYVTYLDAMLLRQLIETAERGDMEGRKKTEVMEKIFARSRKEITSNNVISIGIINMDAVLLTEEQVQENTKAKSDGKKADASQYENIELIAAGLLQDEIFQSEVQFQLSRDLLYGGDRNEIKSVAIDFLNGKGWRSYSLEDELICFQFEGTGEVGIYIRLETQRGTYISVSKLDIRMAERIKPDETGSVAGQSVRKTWDWRNGYAEKRKR